MRIHFIFFIPCTTPVSVGPWQHQTVKPIPAMPCTSLHLDQRLGASLKPQSRQVSPSANLMISIHAKQTQQIMAMGKSEYNSL